MTKKKLKKTIAIIILLVMVFNFVPLQVFAESIEDTVIMSEHGIAGEIDNKTMEVIQ